MGLMTKGGRFLIKGLAGKRVLEGTLNVRGAKNAAPKAAAAALLFSDTLHITNTPDIEDFHRLLELLLKIGVRVKKTGSDSFSLLAKGKIKTSLPRALAKRMRMSVILTGPLLARFGRVSLPHPGGCLIGARPIDLFLDGFKKMGAVVKMKEEGYELSAPREGLHGAEIFFPTISVTGTETLMMAAVLARGTTILRNAALEPEIPALAKFLNTCGADIRGAGTSTITIKGGKLLVSKGKPYVTPPDRIEAGSFLILAALLARDVTIASCEPSHLESLITLLTRAGVHIDVGKHSVRVRGDHKLPYHSFGLKTHEYPGFPTDLQAPMAVFLTQALGEALVFETIFESRLRYVDELVRMGADIMLLDPHRLLVRGPRPLRGKELESPDLRAGLAYIIAALVAEGNSIIHNVYIIDRGYERIEERLKGVGADIRRA
ncbi:MAG: UDP-N-acetylglucosamine 1-carboxyvinyltransferase [Parcubacteria group bacterium]|nr:UDP-N-acetylglucosamine 1-carboxyvinyltransferase [Parcubacteria group bacterium]